VTERVLTLQELNRTLLERQLLLRRHSTRVTGAVERVAGLQAQWANSPYVALWSRLEGFERGQLTRAIKRRALVEATLMRMTLHLVTPRDYVAFAAVFRDDRIDRCTRELAKHAPDLDATAVAQRALTAVGDRAAQRSDYFHAVGEDPSTPPGDMRRWMFWIALQTHGGLVHVPPSGLWGYYGSPTYVSARSWLRGLPSVNGDPRVHLVRRYLAAFGPASTADLKSWSNARGLRPALDALEPELRHYRDEKGRLLLDLRSAKVVDGDVAAPVRLLPKWDASILGYAPPERERILPEKFRKTVIKKNGDIAQTVLVDGFVAAIWNVVKGDVKVEPLRRLTREERTAVEDERERLVAFLAD